MAQSFATQLAKGFVRSTVNQVGRQTGNVIANNMYGNAHAIPYRNAGGSSGLVLRSDKNYQYGDTIEETEHKFVDSSIWTKLFWFFFAILGFWYGALILFINGLYIYCKQTVKTTNESLHEVFIEDGRRKEGWRSLGNHQFTNTWTWSKDECPVEFWNKKQWLGKAYMIWGGIWFIIWLIMIYVFPM